jgi:membrane protein implicated in regulation of membrane protease activity
MIRLVRVTGLLLMTAGAILLAIWFIRPLRFLWPWLRALPWPIQVGLAAAAVGLLLLVGSLIWERLEDRERDSRLRDEGY